MSIALLAFALVACFIWAIVASTAADEWRARYLAERDAAEHAVSFAEDCLDDLRGRDALLGSYRRINGHLCDYIREGRDEESFVADLLASEEGTPLYDSLAVETFRDELGDDFQIARWLT